MAKLALKKAATDVTVYLFAQDSSKTTGEGLTGLAYNTASLTAYYVRPLGSATQITLATQTVTGAHSDGGFKEIDATNMPGVYRLDLPDAVCATGVPSAVVMLKGATNLAPVLLEIQLTDFDLNDASPNVTVNDMATDSLTAAALKADAVTEIQNGLATSADLAVVDENVDAIKEKTDQMAFTVPNKIDASATVDPTGIATDSHLQDVEDKIDKIEAKTDMLDFSKVNVVTPVNGSTITILRGDTFIATLTDIGNLTNYISLDFSVKRTVHEPDDNATIRIRKNVSGTDDGLLRLNGAAHAVGTDGSITIGDTTTGDITITLKAGVTKELVSGNYVYDIQLIEADEVGTLTGGTLVVSPDVTRLVA